MLLNFVSIELHTSTQLLDNVCYTQSVLLDHLCNFGAFLYYDSEFLHLLQNIFQKNLANYLEEGNEI